MDDELSPEDKEIIFEEIHKSLGVMSIWVEDDEETKGIYKQN